MDALVRYGKPVLPLAWLGNDALECLLDLLRSTGDRPSRHVLLPFIDPASGRDQTLSRALGANTCRTHEIFISYHHSDTGPDAVRVGSMLAELYGARRVFIDYVSFLPAQRLEQLVSKAGESRLFIVFLGRNWATRVSDETDYVRRETLAALSGGARIVPVFVDRGAPTEAEVPEVLKALPAINGIHFDRQRWEATMQDLESVIDEALGITRMA